MNGTFEAYKTVAFDIIREQLADLANSAEAREMARGLVPCMEEGELRRSMRDTTQARQLLELAGMPPMPAMEHTAEFVARSVRGELLTPEEMEEIGMFLAAVRRVRSYLDKGVSYGIPLSFYGENLRLMPELKEEIEGAIRHGRVDDRASNALRDIRRDLLLLEEKIKDKAEGLLKSQKKFMAESFLVTRNGRLCLPVKKEYKSKIPGSVIDRSASGSTVFIEPETIARLQDEIEGLRIEEDCEERRILYTLMDKIAMEEDGFKENLALLAKLDFVFAKGKLSAQMEAGEPAINTQGIIRLKGARHPLLPGDANVPLDFELGGEKRGMVITGPNTGGKTVAIKTVGLFVLMACSGLHLPCREADIAMRNLVLCDIGDGQDILDNLSTFSAHITNVLEILKRATGESLVILDELGSGTDPAEGMGIAIAILEQLRLRGCLYLVTTHYPEVKTYAGRHEELISARMAFDRENLRPLYRLEMGKTGDSCALYIAKRLGMPEDMIQTAASEAYGEGADLYQSREKSGEKSQEKSQEKFREKSQEKPPGRQWPGGLERIPVPGIVPIKRKPAAASPEKGFTRGDSVEVLPKGEIGIVVRPADQTGNVLVQVKREKRLINQKRLKLKVRAKELYPEDYDFSIVFDSVENRKARHQMERKYVGNMEARVEE